jgi:hypothetical protein
VWRRVLGHTETPLFVGGRTKSGRHVGLGPSFIWILRRNLSAMEQDDVRIGERDRRLKQLRTTVAAPAAWPCTTAVAPPPTAPWPWRPHRQPTAKLTSVGGRGSREGGC